MAADDPHRYHRSTGPKNNPVFLASPGGFGRVIRFCQPTSLSYREASLLGIGALSSILREFDRGRRVPRPPCPSRLRPVPTPLRLQTPSSIAQGLIAHRCHMPTRIAIRSVTRRPRPGCRRLVKRSRRRLRLHRPLSPITLQSLRHRRHGQRCHRFDPLASRGCPAALDRPREFVGAVNSMSCRLKRKRRRATPSAGMSPQPPRETRVTIPPPIA